MALSFDVRGLPECCGIGLLPGEPRTDCPRCRARYDTALLLQGIRSARQGDIVGINGGFARLQAPAGRAARSS